MADKKTTAAAAVKETATKATTAIKETTEKVAEAAKPVKETIEKTAKDMAAAVETKTKAVKTAAKKATKTTKTTVEKGIKVYVQFQCKEADMDEIFAKIKEQYVAEGHKVSTIKDLKVYVKPEDQSAYYVINNKAAGRIDLF